MNCSPDDRRSYECRWQLGDKVPSTHYCFLCGIEQHTGPLAVAYHRDQTIPTTKEEYMGRNTLILLEITDVLFTEVDEQTTALNRLEQHFHDRLLVNVGDVNIVGEYAKQLRLDITEAERSVVLDYIGEKQVVIVNIDTVEDAINELFEDRFIEP